MTLEERLDEWTRGARGPWLAAIIAVMAALPGFLAMPVLDRDEARFAQASAQMLETRDFTVIRFQDEPRFKKPVGIYWMQALTTAMFSRAEARDIRTYRIPSLLGAALAAAAVAWGAAAFLRPHLAFLSGALLASTILLSTEGFIAKTDAMLCGLIALAMAALARIYLNARGQGPPTGRLTVALLWLGVAGSILVKGPIGPLVVGLSVAALCLWDRDARWLKATRWDWGLITILAVVGPWALAVTVATDGAFWTTAVGQDLAPKLAGGQESHGAPPGYYTLLSPILMFPACLLLPAAAVMAWTGRKDPAVRFAVCWLIPTWIMFELVPTKLVHYTLPAYGGAVWLMALALREPLGRLVRFGGAGVLALGGLLLAAAMVIVPQRFGASPQLAQGWVAAVLFVLAVALGGWWLIRGRSTHAVAAAGLLAICAHAVAVGLIAPGLNTLWVSRSVTETVQRTGLDPRRALVAGPIAVAGYAEPSLVFLLGTPLRLTDTAGALQALREGRPAVVGPQEEAAIRAAMPDLAPAVGRVQGLNYSDGRARDLRLLRPPTPLIGPPARITP
jgi:4-amino-4-deoxy-L-arabinose transferase-like glycosyltransferase